MKSYNCGKILPGCILRGSNFPTTWNTETRKCHVPYNLLYVICIWRTWNYPTKHLEDVRVYSIRVHCCFRCYFINPSFQDTRLTRSHLMKCSTKKFPRFNLNLLLLACYSLNIQKTTTKRKKNQFKKRQANISSTKPFQQLQLAK